MDQEHIAGPPGDGDGAGRRRFLAMATGAATAAGLGAVAGCAQGDGDDGDRRADGTNGSPAPDGKPSAAGGHGLDVKAENARPGHADWAVTKAGPARAVEGFADKVSVLPGESFGLYVSTTAPRFTVSAYRMGWYGGARARLVWRSEALPGVRQPEHTVDSDTRMVRTRWARTTTVETKDWPEGSYLLRLDAQGGEGGQRFVPVTVRSAATTGRTVVVNAVATWQAYNRWGGYGSYDGPGGGFASRSLSVSFDRPYEYDDGAGLFLVYEAPLIALAERLGAPLAYATTTDVAREKRLLEGAAAVLSLGHDEYWSPEQRAHFTAARDAGTNIAILGANCCFRRIRLEASELGPDRTLVCYKSSYGQDPGFKRGHPATVDFRSAPGADPESSLLGVIYDGYPVDAPYVVTNPGHWLFEGTGAKAGDRFEHLVGVEYDKVNTGFTTPRPIEILAHSPVVCEGRPSHQDTAYYTVPSGAGVFATGTMRWVEALDATGDGRSGRNHGLDARSGALTTRVTENLLRVFAAGPAGRSHPAQDNVKTVYGSS
ncbi:MULTISPECIES: N,N-dimethylformamidase beta subunit family domain-containing protein [Streptomyces]|uniref:N,N-dimethylformamidase beta subunit family domain-containing protein n=1 Tax=Streptomyces TaxID=1883 RepID=UPI0004C9CEAE|nr:MULTISPECIES: N,N-dimethylformamidase beta subunit family domain-containing protein [unclassified Streptomyces]